MKNSNEIDEEEIEDEGYDDDEKNDVNGEAECPFCQFSEDCDHIIATFAVTEGAISGPICEHESEMLSSIQGFILELETLPPPFQDSFSYQELRASVIASRSTGKSLLDAFDAEYGLALGVLRDILEHKKDVSCQEYEIDEASGTWGYIRYFANDPHQVIAEVRQYLSARE